MLKRFGQALRKAQEKIANAIFLDKNLVEVIVKELQRALIEADVEILLVKKISDKIRKSAFDERIKEIEKKEHLIKLLHEELMGILGKPRKLELKENKQTKIMLLGLYAAGKTTTISKIANWFAKRGKKVAMVGLDVNRPAAKEQLIQLGEKNNIKVFTDLEEKNALKIWKKFEKELKKFDLVLIDTAGRHTLDKELVKEIKDLGKEIKPDETILVMPADIGQAAKKQAKEFQETLKISGVIITRMDSSAKGGGSLTACAETGVGVYFITNGEKINDIEEFNPNSFLSRLLGMGDLETLLEKIKSVTDEKKQAKLQKKLEEGKISLEDVIEQVKSMNQMGGFEKLKGLIPGMGKVDISEDKLGVQEQKVKKWEHIIKSMTTYEKENPEVIQKQTARVNRIAKGAGVNNSDVKSLLKQYDLLKSFVKDSSNMDVSQGMSQKQMQKLMKKFGKKKMKRFV